MFSLGIKITKIKYIRIFSRKKWWWCVLNLIIAVRFFLIFGFSAYTWGLHAWVSYTEAGFAMTRQSVYYSRRSANHNASYLSMPSASEGSVLNSTNEFQNFKTEILNFLPTAEGFLSFIDLLCIAEEISIGGKAM